MGRDGSRSTEFRMPHIFVAFSISNNISNNIIHPCSYMVLSYSDTSSFISAPLIACHSLSQLVTAQFPVASVVLLSVSPCFSSDRFRSPPVAVLAASWVELSGTCSWCWRRCSRTCRTLSNFVEVDLVVSSSDFVRLRPTLSDFVPSSSAISARSRSSLCSIDSIDSIDSMIFMFISSLYQVYAGVCSIGLKRWIVWFVRCWFSICHTMPHSLTSTKVSHHGITSPYLPDSERDQSQF